MKKIAFKFFILLLLALGMSWGIYALTSPPENITMESEQKAEHYITYQLPFGLPAIPLRFYW